MIVHPRPVRMVARAQTLSIATRVHVQVVIPALRVRSVRNVQIEPPLKQSDSFADKYGTYYIKKNWHQLL